MVIALPPWSCPFPWQVTKGYFERISEVSALWYGVGVWRWCTSSKLRGCVHMSVKFNCDSKRALTGEVPRTHCGGGNTHALTCSKRSNAKQ